MEHNVIVAFEGTVYEKGFGHIAKVVMTDKTISVTAKAIYAYLCSYCFGSIESGKSSFPSVKTQCDDLCIKSEKTYYAHRKQLEDAGYIRIETTRTKKGYKKNIYHIASVAKKKEENPTSKKYQVVQPVKNTSKPTGKKYRVGQPVKNTGRIQQEKDLNTTITNTTHSDDDFEFVNFEWKKTFGQALKKSDYKKLVKISSVTIILNTVKSIHNDDSADDIAHPVNFVKACLKNGGYKVKTTVKKRKRELESAPFPRSVQAQLEGNIPIADTSDEHLLHQQRVHEKLRNLNKKIEANNESRSSL